MAHAIATVKRYFPGVETVKDAKRGINVEVTSRDQATSKRKKHNECAMAVACKRALHLDGVIISVKTAYLIKGKTAIRFRVPERVSREIVSFDRGSDFASGIYKLDKPDHALGDRPNGKGHGPHRRTYGRAVPHHITTGIRTVLGSKDIS